MSVGLEIVEIDTNTVKPFIHPIRLISRFTQSVILQAVTL